MSRPVAVLVAAIVMLASLVAAGPTLIALAHAALPLVVAVGVVVVLIRLASWLTGRW